MRQPGLLLLPGLLCDATVWADQRLTLSPFANCVVPDYDNLDNITEMARAAVLAAPDGPLAVAGHSMGGRVALEIARLYPRRVKQLALLDTGTDPIAGGPMGQSERTRRAALLEIARHKGMRKMGEDWAKGMVHPARLDTPVFEEILEMIERNSVERFEAQVRALISRPDARGVYADLRCPTLLICGRHDTWSSLARHEDMHRSLPHSRLVVIEDSGHMTTMEQPDAVSTALLEWLRAEQPS